MHMRGHRESEPGVIVEHDFLASLLMFVCAFMMISDFFHAQNKVIEILSQKQP